MKKLWKVIVGAAAVALLLTACGGKSNGGNNGSASQNSYTIIWKNWDGKILETDRNVPEGTTPTYDGAEPTRADDEEYTYTFSGWNPAIYPVSKNETYYATFAAEEIGGGTYTITWKNWDGEVLETDTDVEKGTMPHYDGNTPTRPNDDNYSYTWLGWEPELAEVTRNQAYTATYSRKELITNFTIDFDLDGGSSPSYTGPKTVTSLDKSNFFFDVTKEGWKFRGWYYNNKLVYDQYGNVQELPTIAKTMTFKAGWSQGYQLRIVSNLEGAATFYGEGEYKPGDSVTFGITKVNEGFTFQGWYYENSFLGSDNPYEFDEFPDSDILIEARFRYVSYTLSIQTSREDYGLVLIDAPGNTEYRSSYEGTFDYRTNVTIKAQALADTLFLGWFDVEGKNVSSDATYTLSMPNKDYSLLARWNYFTITYELNGGTNNPDNPAYYTYNNENLVLKTPTRDGYDFLGWRLDGEYVTSISRNEFKDYTLVAVWELHTYNIIYYVNGGVNNLDNPTTFTINSETITLLDPERTGYTFLGWYDSTIFNHQVTTIPQGTHEDVTLYARWEIIYYSITYHLDGGTNSASNPSNYTVNTKFTFGPATKTGCDFAGWYDTPSFDRQITYIDAGTTGALHLYAKWTAHKYTLTILVNDASGGTATVVAPGGYESGIPFGTYVTVEANASDSNYTFEGWYDISSGNIVSIDTSYTFTMPAKNLQLRAAFWTASEKADAIDKGFYPSVDVINKKVTFGLYPQSRVTDESLISTLNALSPQVTGWYLYNNQYYANAEGNPHTPSGTYRTCFSDGTPVEQGETYWFICEKITWRILEQTGTGYYLLSEDCLDVSLYSAGSSNSYINSYLRIFLNNDFYSKAFFQNKSFIPRNEIDNSAATTSSDTNPYACGNTWDNVFCPSYQDYKNSSYGFGKDSSVDHTNVSRQAWATDWCRANGAYIYQGSVKNKLDKYTAEYWTRSPANEAGRALIVLSGGYIVSTSELGDSSTTIRPAIYLKSLNY